jgi:hypothetical protein
MADVSAKPKYRGCIFGSIIVVILLVILGAVGSYFDKDNVWARSHLYLHELAIACKGTGISSAAIYSSESGTHKTILFDTRGNLHKWNNDLPTNWIPEDISKTELVVCIGEEEDTTIETCNYRGGPPITRYQKLLHAYIISAQTGEEIERAGFYGPMPEDCPYATASKETRIDGGDVMPSQIQTWLAKYVDSSTLAIHAPTVTSFVSTTLTSTNTPQPTPIEMATSSAPPVPVEVTFDTIGNYPTGQLVILVGRIALMSGTTCSLQTCGLLLENPDKPSQKMTIFITVGTNPNQMKLLPDNYTKSDIQVYLNDGSVAVVYYRVRVTGRVCITSSDEPCISDIVKIELFQLK